MGQGVNQKSGGGTGIRTLEGLLTLAGFQDRCFQPLSHPSKDDFSVTKNEEKSADMAEGQGFEPWKGY